MLFACPTSIAAVRPPIVLGYHGIADIDPAHDPVRLFVSPARLRAQVTRLKKRGYELVHMAEFARRLHARQPLRGVAALTFDDGTRDIAETAAPLLAELNVPGTVYVCPGLFGKPYPWSGEAAGVRLMTADEVVSLAGEGTFEIGSPRTITRCWGKRPARKRTGTWPSPRIASRTFWAGRSPASVTRAATTPTPVRLRRDKRVTPARSRAVLGGSWDPYEPSEDAPHPGRIRDVRAEVARAVLRDARPRSCPRGEVADPPLQTPRRARVLSRRMRVLQTAQPPHGGVAEHIRAVSLQLAAWGEAQVEAALAPDSRVIEPLREAGIPTHEIHYRPSLTSAGADLRALRELVALIRARSFDLIHAHGAKAGVLGRLAGVLTRTPVVYTPHGWAFNEYEFRDPSPSRLHHVTVVQTERRLARLARFTICVSRFEEYAAAAQRLPHPERRRVVHHGVEVDRRAEPDPQLIEWKADGVLIGAVSVFRPEKGLNHLVEAAAILRERAPGVRVALVGEGDEREALERQIARLDLGQVARVFSYGGSVEPHLAALDCFALPSFQFEAAGIGVLEAMAMGLPVVASRIGGVPESVRDGETGVLVSPGDPSALAGAILELAADGSTRRRMGEAGQAVVAEGFTLGREATRLAALYREASRD